MKKTHWKKWMHAFKWVENILFWPVFSLLLPSLCWVTKICFICISFYTFKQNSVYKLHWRFLYTGLSSVTRLFVFFLYIIWRLFLITDKLRQFGHYFHVCCVYWLLWLIVWIHQIMATLRLFGLGIDSRRNIVCVILLSPFLIVHFCRARGWGCTHVEYLIVRPHCPKTVSFSSLGGFCPPPSPSLTPLWGGLESTECLLRNVCFDAAFPFLMASGHAPCFKSTRTTLELEAFLVAVFTF